MRFPTDFYNDNKAECRTKKHNILIWSQEGSKGGCVTPPASAQSLHGAGDTFATDRLWLWRWLWRSREQMPIQRVTTVVLLVLCAQQSAQELMLQHWGAQRSTHWEWCNHYGEKFESRRWFFPGKIQCTTLKVITKGKSYQVARCRYVLNA